MKVVFDTNTVVSALLFRGKLSGLVEHWQQSQITPLICEQTRAEFLRVLGYPKFKLNATQIEIMMDWQSFKDWQSYGSYLILIPKYLKVMDWAALDVLL